MKRALVTALVLAGAAALASPAPPASRTVAYVNGDPITGAEVLAEFTKLHGGHAKFLGGEAEARQFLERVIDKALLIQEAYRLGLDQQENIRKNTDEFRDAKAVEYLLRTEIDEKATPTAEQVRQAWERNTAVLYELRIIEVPTRDEADAVFRELLSGAGFDDLARTCSIAASRIYGGKLPLVGWGSLEPALEAAAFSLEPGDTAPPVKTASGWGIVRMEASHPVERPEFDKAKEKVESILKQRGLAARKTEYSAYLFAKYHAKEGGISLTPAALAEVLAKSPESAVEIWDGGSLAVKEFVSKQDLASLAKIPPSRAGEHVHQLLRQTVNDALTRREATERRIADVPEVAAQIKEHREELMEGALYADYILKDVSVSDAEARAFFDKHRSEWTTPERRRVAHILVKTKDEAVRIRGKLAVGEGFAELAKKDSIDTQTKSIGGDLGWITRKDIPAAFSAILTFKVEQVSEPIESKFGWHLIKVTAIEVPKPKKFDDAKDDVTKSLIERKNTARRAEWVSKLRAAAKIKIDEKSLREFAKANAA